MRIDKVVPVPPREEPGALVFLTAEEIKKIHLSVGLVSPATLTGRCANSGFTTYQTVNEVDTSTPNLYPELCDL